MNDTAQHPIWPSATGITDLEADMEASSASEITGIQAIWAEQRERLKGTAALSDFTEKLSREWAIETGVIENLYEIERGVTQTLIEQGFEAELLFHGSTNKPREYVLQLLRDQKDALDGVFDFIKEDRPLGTSYVKELHAALLRSQDETDAVNSLGRHGKTSLIKGDWKRQDNHPVRDGVTYTYCPYEHAGAEMDRLIALYAGQVEKGVPTEVRAAWLHHRFTQIHPFQDGNGRVARALASLVLVKDGLFPLVVTRDDRSRYLDALEAADGGDLEPLVALIVKLQIVRFQKAAAISEMVLAEADVQKALDNLHEAVTKIEAERLEKFRKVFDLAGDVLSDLEERLNAIKPTIQKELRRIASSVDAWVTQAKEGETDHYFRADIIQNAKNHIGYFADTSEYRSWISLHMRWSRRAELVFAVHGIGRPFNGSLICAPFLLFRDTDEDGTTRTLVPVTDEGFVFFYTEDRERLLARFRPWRENMLKIALVELGRNL